MKKYLRLTPVFCTAAGSAISFYFLSAFAFSFKILLYIIPVVAIICFSFTVFFDFAVIKDLRFNLSRKLRFSINCLFVFLIGLVLGFNAEYAGRKYVNFGLLQDNITAIEGVLKEDPRIISGGKAMANLSLKRCAAMTPNGIMRATAWGEIAVFFPAQNTEKLREFGRGTSVFLEGYLRSSSAETFTFSADSLHVVKPASRIERLRTGIRLKLIERTEEKEWGGLAIALLLGIRDNLDFDLAASYRKAGSSYILALSGMHLAVLAAIIAFLLKKPLGIKPAALVGAVFICVYCFFTGPMPSLYRAALMYFLGVIAIFGFLPRQPLSILSLSFLIQLIATPSAGHTISFMLSYLALFGIIVISYSLYEIFAGIIPDIVLQPLSASFAAFLATAGIAGSVFGYVAPVGIFLGLILVPLTTLYMILSILWLVLGNIMVGNLLTLPLSFLYVIMESIVNAAAKVPAITSDNSVFFIAVSVALPIIILLFERYQRKKRLNLQSYIIFPY